MDETLEASRRRMTRSKTRKFQDKLNEQLKVCYDGTQSPTKGDFLT